MKMSDKGIAALKAFEGCRLQPYVCSGGKLTIGYGSTGPHVKPGMKITQKEADALLLKDLDRFEKAVTTALENSELIVPQYKFDAMVSLAFNIGITAFNRSSVLKLWLQGKNEAAANAFLKWNKANGKVNAGLVRRREAERRMFLGL